MATSDLEPTVDVDDARAQRARIAIPRAILTAIARDKWRRTHCTHTLATNGRGVPDNPFVPGRPVTGIRWSDTARQTLGAKRITGFEPAYQFEPPPPEPGLTYAQYSALMEQAKDAYLNGGPAT